jgi:phosphatidylglycerophosphate synthase
MRLSSFSTNIEIYEGTAMNKQRFQFVVVQSMTASRVVMAIGLVSVALQVPPWWAVIYYGLMLLTDVLDGILARSVGCETRGGEWFDRFGDRCVAISCILLGVEAGIPSIIATLFLVREVLFASMPGLISTLNEPAWARLIGHVGGVPLRAAAGYVLIGRVYPICQSQTSILYSVALTLSLLCGPARLWYLRFAMMAAFREPKHSRACQPDKSDLVSMRETANIPVRRSTVLRKFVSSRSPDEP